MPCRKHSRCTSRDYSGDKIPAWRYYLALLRLVASPVHLYSCPADRNHLARFYVMNCGTAPDGALSGKGKDASVAEGRLWSSEQPGRYYPYRQIRYWLIGMFTFCEMNGKHGVITLFWPDNLLILPRETVTDKNCPWLI